MHDNAWAQALHVESGSAVSFVVRCFSLLLLIISGTVSAAPLVMAFSESAPWKMYSESSGYGGIDVEVAKIVAQRLGVELQIKPAPLARCLEMIRHGEADLMTNIIMSPDRTQFIRYLDVPYQHESDKVFYLRADSHLDVSRYEDLYGLEIGTKRGAIYSRRFDLDTALHKRDVAVPLRNFKKLLLGRVDVVVSTESEGDYLLKQNGLTHHFKKAALRFNQPLAVYMGLSRQSRFVERAPEFERVLAELVASGELEQIKQRYLSRSG